MRYDQIVRSRDGQQRHIQHVNEVKIPDAWHALMVLQDQVEGIATRPLTANDVEALMETWHLCHDLLTHVKRINAEPNS